MSTRLSIPVSNREAVAESQLGVLATNFYSGYPRKSFAVSGSATFSLEKVGLGFREIKDVGMHYTII